MAWTRSQLELPFSPIEVLSSDTRIIACDLTNYLQSGTVNSLTVKVLGGPLDAQNLWIDVTATMLPTSTLTGNVASITVKSFTVGYGYRVVLVWNSAATGNYQTLSRFFIVRCLY